MISSVIVRRAMAMMALQRVRCLAWRCVRQATWHPGILHAELRCTMYICVCVWFWPEEMLVSCRRCLFLCPVPQHPSFTPSWGTHTSLLVSSKSGSGLSVAPAAVQFVYSTAVASGICVQQDVLLQQDSHEILQRARCRYIYMYIWLLEKQSWQNLAENME